MITNKKEKAVSNKQITPQSSPYTEDWIPIKGIKDGMIYLPQNFKVTGVKITPRNIFIMDDQQQDNILNALKNFYNMLNFEFWLISADRPVDIALYQSQLQLLYSNNESSPAIQKLIQQDMAKANLFVANNVVDTEYYILFRDKEQEVIDKKIRLLINGLGSCSLNASQTSDEDLRIILDNFLNGGVRTEFGTVLPL